MLIMLSVTTDTYVICCLSEVDYIEHGNPRSVAMQGILSEPKTVKDIATLLADSLHTRVDVLGDCDENILLSNISVCSGSGSFY